MLVLGDDPKITVDCPTTYMISATVMPLIESRAATCGCVRT